MFCFDPMAEREARWRLGREGWLAGRGWHKPSFYLSPFFASSSAGATLPIRGGCHRPRRGSRVRGTAPWQSVQSPCRDLVLAIWITGIPAQSTHCTEYSRSYGTAGHSTCRQRSSAPDGRDWHCDGHFSELTILDQTYGAAARWYFYNIFWEPAGWWVWNGRSPTVLAPGRGVAGAL